MKYIDADRLRAEIESRKDAILSFPENGIVTFEAKSAVRSMAKGLLSFIDSLQQEQPEVDLEKEIDEMWNPRFNLGWDDNSLLSINHKSFEVIARHFFNRGFNARKEE